MYILVVFACTILDQDGIFPLQSILYIESDGEFSPFITDGVSSRSLVQKLLITGTIESLLDGHIDIYRDSDITKMMLNLEYSTKQTSQT